MNVINSKFSLLRGVGALIIPLIFLFSVMPIILSQSYEPEENGDLPRGFYIFWALIAASFLIYQILTRVNKIHIEEDRLTSTNVLSRKKKEIDLSNIDGYRHTTERAISGPYDLITLRKDGVSLLKISSFYYSNYKELKEALAKRLDQIE